jgi:hypothetical protein
MNVLLFDPPFLDSKKTTKRPKKTEKVQKREAKTGPKVVQKQVKSGLKITFLTHGNSTFGSQKVVFCIFKV